jgi:predicted RNase H-like HicB family nuclease
MTYKTVIHQETEGGFWGEIPQLPGCYSQGDTVPELMENLREAAGGYLEVLKEQGKSPEPEVEIRELVL